MTLRVTLLSGGVGGAKLALGFYAVLPPELFTVVVNSGDDLNLFNLRICPDSDILVYTLAGQVNEALGWGIRGDSFRALERAKALGATPWFNLGDVDLGLHLYRSQALAQGLGLAEITRKVCQELGVKCTVLPMCEQYVPTQLDTGLGELHLQEYLVKHRAEPVVKALRFAGVDQARPAPGIAQAFAQSDMIVIAPSNPLISIAPILAVPQMGKWLKQSKALKVAVSPVVGGKSLKGPTDKMLAELGHEVSPLGVAKLYREYAQVFVVDRQDSAYKPQIEAMGMRCHVADTVMLDLQCKQRLAQSLLSLLGKS